MKWSVIVLAFYTTSWYRSILRVHSFQTHFMSQIYMHHGTKQIYSKTNQNLVKRDLVLELTSSPLITQPNTDKQAILRQLGYVPSNFLFVSSRRGDGSVIGDKNEMTGSPLVIKTYPLNGGASRRKLKSEGKLTPFPTLYWFCCPHVGRAVSELERNGYVGILEERLKSDEKYLRQFIKNHEAYADERWNTLTDEDKNLLMKLNDRMRNMIRYSGIAGTDYSKFVVTNDINGCTEMNPSIKCLHAHYAHYRSQCAASNHKKSQPNMNIVGEWVHELLIENFPSLIL
mmetsp:Transcript_1217/g.1721  ORF Transcript_1217/g.1721 Transcript_1217/m.1721 type:complete len:286 (+) Transcript_1217:54-911(+)